MLAQAGADRDHPAQCGGEAKGLGCSSHGRREVAGVGRQEDDPDGGAGRDRVHHLDIACLFVASLVWQSAAGQAGNDLEPGIWQSEAPVEEREVLPDIARCRRPRFWVELWQDYGLAPAVDPSGDQRLDAIRDPELLWGVT